MRISDSSITMSSSHAAEILDVTVSEKTSGTTRREAQEGAQGAADNTGDPLSGFLVDRIRISSSADRMSQYNYQGSLVSRSEVLAEDGESQTLFENRQMVEKMVGAVIDRDVTAGQLRLGASVPMEDDGGIPGGWQASLTQTDIHYEDEQMAFSTTGHVTTEDGREINFSLELAMDRAYLSRTEQSTLVEVWQERINLTDPLVVSLDGGMPSLSDTTFSFDLDNDGQAEDVHFAGQGSGFLAFDKNMDGRINNGSELFGPGTGNGFGELAAYDSDGNAWIDENDAVFEQLSVWTRDENGQDRLISLKEAGIGAIALTHAATQFSVTDEDNAMQGQVRNSGVFLFENGNVGAVQQIDLAHQEPEIETETAWGSNEILFESGGIPVLEPGTISPLSLEQIPEPAENPLDQLIKNVEALKAKMERLLTRQVADRENDLRLSTYSLYRLINPDLLQLASEDRLA